MKKILAVLLIQLLIITPALANSNTITIISSWNNTVSNIDIHSNLVTRKEIFNYYAEVFRDLTPVSYKYIDLKYTDVVKWSKLYDSLQILVYYNLLDNKESRIYPRKNLAAFGLYTLSEKVLWVKVLKHKNETELKSRYGSMNDLIFITTQFNKELKIIETSWDTSTIKKKKEIFQDVYDVLSEQHYKKDDYTKLELLDKAIEGLTLATNDKHTTYFPPVETAWFQDSINWEFEWIWAYVEMEKPGKFMIISPITDSPAFNAGLKWWDQVTHVDWEEIWENNSAKEVISWIKWPKGTSVVLTIQRGTKELEIEVIRDQIIIKDIETEKVSYNTFLISIRSFWPNVSENFKEALTELSEEKNIKKVIIDLRNNGGGYLDQVADMLSYLVPEWENTAVIKYLKWDHEFKSAWYELIDFNKYKIIILQNSGTASASEILAWTLKDYYPEAKLLGEQSYGKWSVQRMKEYKDGSLLKYTIARWYTGWSETSIDWIWLTPDILLEFDAEAYEKYETDNQLNKAIKLR
jgi:carboxyl-terminal processing protease